MIVDLFAGPGGWDVGLWMLGGHELVERCLGVEWDAGACATRREAGLRTLQGDVAVWRPTSLCSPGMLEGLIASPPCKAFSKAGKREGIEHAPALARAILEERWDFRPVDDPLVWLALEVGRWASALRPRWIACEQVPEALPLWHAYRTTLERWGYSAWCGVVSAEQYGVPQTRERSILVASLDRRVGPPPPTHQRYESRNGVDGQLGFLLPWVSMAQALGWRGEEAPARTLAGHRQPRWLYDDAAGTRGRMVGFPRLEQEGRSSSDGYRDRDRRHEDEPALTLTEKARSWTVATGMNSMKHSRDVEDMVPHERSIDAPAPTLDGKVGGAWTVGPEGHRQPPHSFKLRGSNPRDNATERSADEPAMTIAFGHAGPEWVEEELVLNTGLDWKEGGDRDDAQQIPVDAPAPGLTAKSGTQWQWRRPATTVAGDERLWPPGHKENGADPPGKYQQRRGDRAQKLSLEQALLLQSFPPDYPILGNKSKSFEQVGNAVPPLLAAHVLAVVLGMEAPSGS